MKKIFFTPGPSQLVPNLKKYLLLGLDRNIFSISHRSNYFMRLVKTTKSNLRKILSLPDTHSIFFMSSALESMEKILENVASSESFHCVNGAFSKKWYEYAKKLGIKANSLTVEEGKGFDFRKVKIPKNTELICMTHNETSTGVMIPLEEIYQLKKLYPDIPLALDIVSSAPYPKVDYSKIDISFFSVQKGFGLPAGLCILIINKKLINDQSINTFHSFENLRRFEEKNQTPETPNVLGIYLLNEVCKKMRQSGIEKIRKQTIEKANLLYSYFDTNKHCQIFVENPKWRSPTVIVINTKNKTKVILKKLARAGFIVGKGYGKYQETQIRIANFPQHKISDVKKLLKAFDKSILTK